MPPRFPVADHAIFRDLNFFEERLKETAAALQRRKHKYQLFLIQQLLVVTILLFEVFLPPEYSLLGLLYKGFLGRIRSEIYNEQSIKTPHLDPYITSGLLFVSVTTLVLFFASGMYYDKIAYANKYVPHANKSLRSYNMYFNTRKPPLRSKFKWNPLSFFFPRPTITSSPSSPLSPRSRSPTPITPPPPPTLSTSSSTHSRRSTSSSISSSSSSSSSSSRPIPTIPPATNPRGELIFSSRVDKSFREGYERYRSVFEKKRTEALFHIRQQKHYERWGWFYRLKFWGDPIIIPSSQTLTPGQTPTPTSTPQIHTTGSYGSIPSTPTRTPTPTPTSTSNSSTVIQIPTMTTIIATASTSISRKSSVNRGRRGGGSGGSRSGTPTPSGDRNMRQRGRSYSPLGRGAVDDNVGGGDRECGEGEGGSGSGGGGGGGGGRSMKRNQKDGEKVMDIRMKTLERSLLK